MIKINLLPKEVQEKGRGTDYVILGCAVVVLFIVFGTISYVMKVQNYKKDLKKKDRWSQRLQEIKGKVAQVEQLDGQKKLLNAKKDTVIQLFQGRLLYPKMMETFFDTLPKDVWVTDISLTEDGQRNIMIIANSSSLSTEAIAEWLGTLESKPDKFSQVSLSAIEVKQTDAKQAPVYGFSMTFTYKPPVGG